MSLSLRKVLSPLEQKVNIISPPGRHIASHKAGQARHVARAKAGDPVPAIRQCRCRSVSRAVPRAWLPNKKMPSTPGTVAMTISLMMSISLSENMVSLTIDY
ncbi:MAG: hypothetical protein MZV49_14930 [Rhodopseudomonas palustris]|nr:hypothetical protein [Rhodopseudomonas palustris]